MFNLWYLVDQTASGQQGIYDVKSFTGSYASLALAQAQATADGIAHYSVEQKQQDDGTGWDLVFIC